MFEDLLIHTVEVHRRSGRIDRLGQPVDVNPRQHDQGEPVTTYRCKLTRASGGLTMEERSIDVFQYRWKLYTELGVDIRTDDAVRVLDENMVEIMPLSKITNKSVSAGLSGHDLEFIIWTQQGPS